MTVRLGNAYRVRPAIDRVAGIGVDHAAVAIVGQPVGTGTSRLAANYLALAAPSAIHTRARLVRDTRKPLGMVPRLTNARRLPPVDDLAGANAGTTHPVANNRCGLVRSRVYTASSGSTASRRARGSPTVGSHRIHGTIRPEPNIVVLHRRRTPKGGKQGQPQQASHGSILTRGRALSKLFAQSSSTRRENSLQYGRRFDRIGCAGCKRGTGSQVVTRSDRARVPPRLRLAEQERHSSPITSTMNQARRSSVRSLPSRRVSPHATPTTSLRSTFSPTTPQPPSWGLRPTRSTWQRRRYAVFGVRG
jgi:hypothetical protein